jgi:serine/threonine protein kinase
LKPANIMLTKSGVKLLDFGLARIDRQISADDNTVTAGLTTPGAVLGTFHYMAPNSWRERLPTRAPIFLLSARCCVKC